MVVSFFIELLGIIGWLDSPHFPKVQVPIFNFPISLPILFKKNVADRIFFMNYTKLLTLLDIVGSSRNDWDLANDAISIVATITKIKKIL